MKVSKANQRFFIMSLVALLKGGKGFTLALHLMSEGVGKNAEIAKQVMANYGDNEDVFEAFEGFDQTVRVAAAAASDRGIMTQGLEMCLESMKVVSASGNKLTFIIVMPLVLLFTMLGLGVWVGVDMLPQFADMVPRAHWPIGTTIVWEYSHFMADNYAFVIAGFVGVVVIYRWSLPNWEYSPSRAFMEKIWPGYAIYRMLQSQSFLEMLSMLMDVDSGLSKGLVAIKERATPYMRSHIEEMEFLIGDEKGDVIMALDTGLVYEDDIGIISSLSNNGADLASGIRPVVSKGREVISQKLEWYGIWVQIIFVIIIMVVMGSLMSSMLPLVLEFMSQQGV